MIRRIAFVALIAMYCAGTSFAEGDSTLAENEKAVRAAGVAYVNAFNKRDAKKLASFWSAEAVYTNRATGEQMVGRKAIAEQFNALFADVPKIKLEVDVASLQFVSPNVAVEQGTATFLAPNAEPEPISYSAVYVRHDGKWLLDRVTDEPLPIQASNAEHLKDLEWMIGSWVDSDEGVTIDAECNWTKNQNFITREFAVTIGDQIDLSGVQIIGWDAAAKQVRSWTFDSAGGFSEGVWSKTKNGWYVRKQGTTADGQAVTAVNVITTVDNNSFKLQSIERTIAGKMLPNVPEVLVVRQ